MSGAVPAVIAIFGPTASGKSAIAAELAARLKTEVVSADAMQVYDGLPILTNQPAAPTRLVGFWPLEREMSVGEYQRLAHAAIDTLVESRGAAVVAGGTGLYLRAALADLCLPPAPPDGVRAKWEKAYDQSSLATYAELVARDPRAAAAVHVNDRRRVVRALELVEADASLVPDADRLWSDDTRHATLVVGLDVPTEELDKRIASRAREMFAGGVADEVRGALTHGISRTAEKALGIAEIASLPPAAAEQAIVTRTRRYAAYQRKWMRRIPRLTRVDATRPAHEVAAAILAVVSSRGEAQDSA